MLKSNSAAIGLMCLGLLVQFDSCAPYHRDKEDPGSRARSQTDVKTISRGSVGFASVYEKVFQPSCVSCHAVEFPGSPKLTNFAEIKPLIRSIDDAVFVRRSMPRNSTLTQAQRDHLRSWIDDGAPETAACPPAPPVADPPVISPALPVTWSKLRKEVIEVSCAMCHFTGNAAGLTDQTDLQTFKASIGTTLYLTLVEKGSPMPPLPSKLTDDQKRMISNWLIDGQRE